jgi:Fe-S cluster biogenesis protein NfuA
MKGNAMFIQTEDTPNPATMKFLPGRDVLGLAQGGALEITDAASAAMSPLAQTLLAIDGVTGVFLGRDFITVTRGTDKDWAALKPMLLTAIMEHFVTDRPVLTDEAATQNVLSSKPQNEVIRQICEILDEKIRPAVAQDGGDVTFHSFEDGVVYLTLKGACAGCPSATATLKLGVEKMLRKLIPEVSEVRQKRP